MHFSRNLVISPNKYFFHKLVGKWVTTYMVSPLRPLAVKTLNRMVRIFYCTGIYLMVLQLHIGVKLSAQCHQPIHFPQLLRSVEMGMCCTPLRHRKITMFTFGDQFTFKRTCILTCGTECHPTIIHRRVEYILIVLIMSGYYPIVFLFSSSIHLFELWFTNRKTILFTQRQVRINFEKRNHLLSVLVIHLLEFEVGAKVNCMVDTESSTWMADIALKNIMSLLVHANRA